MAKPSFIQLGNALKIPILYEDRSVIAIDKPAGWLLVPAHWDKTGRNLQLAIDSSIRSGEFWAKSRNIKFLRFVHRLDAETSGVLLFARSPGAVPVYSKLFEARAVQKHYLAVTDGVASNQEWTCKETIGPDPLNEARMRIDMKGKDALTHFTVIEQKDKHALLLAQPITGRTHQIRVHLANRGFPVVGDILYGKGGSPSEEFQLGLRAASLEFKDPFSGRSIQIRADNDQFLRAFGYQSSEKARSFLTAKRNRSF